MLTLSYTQRVCSGLLKPTYYCYKSQNQFLTGKVGKLSAMIVNGLTAISFFLQREPHVQYVYG
jgi:hypothetical protein